VLTVFTLSDSSLAISDTDCPDASLQKIWNSRSDRPACSGLSWSVSSSDTSSSARLALT
jgi:hypothetical protein